MHGTDLKILHNNLQRYKTHQNRHCHENIRQHGDLAPGFVQARAMLWFARYEVLLVLCTTVHAWHCLIYFSRVFWII
jgi:hypothetical protein